MKHFLTLADFSKEDILEILELSFQIKKETKA
jgi:ornithine carbamoyltransferase